MEGEERVNIGDAIKEIRKRSLLCQQDFAKVLGVSFSTVNRWENNRAMPGYQALNKIRTFCEEREIPFNIEKFILEENDESN